MVLFDWTSIILALQNYGLYDFILPFLLLFAVVFGILSYMKIFGGNKGIHVIIALVIGLLATRFPFFADFLNLVSPRLGVGIFILLTLLILIGLFTPDKSQAIMGWIFIGVAVIIALVVFGQVYNIMGGFGSNFGGSSELIGGLIIVGLLVGVIVAVVVGNAGSHPNGGNNASTNLKGLWGQ